MLYDTKAMNSCEFQIYNKWFDAFNEETSVTHVIYVKTDPSICHNRVLKRSRPGEANITKEYLSSCHNYHEKMIDAQNKTDILVLDGNENIFDDNILHKWIDSILKFIPNPKEKLSK
jgi:deoxyadenosine/deoxycytidine kinase